MHRCAKDLQLSANKCTLGRRRDCRAHFTHWREYMKKTTGLIILALMMSGCMTTRTAYVQNGTEVFEANCNGLARTIADCYA